MNDSSLLAIVPVVSVVVGAGLTWFATARTEEARWTRAHHARWDERRLGAYIEYASAVKRETQLCLRMGVSQGLGPMISGPLDRVTGLELLDEAEQQRGDLWEAVLLLGDAATIEAARRWHAAVWALRETVDGSRTVEQPEFLSLFRVAGHARDAFHKAARESLSVGGDFLDMPVWGAE